MENGSETRRSGPYTSSEGLSLTLAYLEDPSSVECPRCGPGHIEIVGYADPERIGAGEVVLISPDDNYSVLLYCHRCTRAAALHLTFRQRHENREAA
ncbi:MAG: hypothetical protein L0271_19875 [Gemmatimonadetes bacterium]|nr:hypothetical protein [Gemmatimonadota bacterium]